MKRTFSLRAMAGSAALAAALGGGLMAGGASAQGATGPGTITTVAGGPGVGPAHDVAQSPATLALGPGGAVYVGDEYGAIREFTTRYSYEKVIAGSDTYALGHVPGYLGDGGPATRAGLTEVHGLAVDAHGNLVFSDADNERIRVVATTSGTFYGRAMTAGDIYTIAGTGTAGFSGDGGPAASAELDDPEGLTVDSAGNIVFGDFFNNRMRVIAAKTGTFYGQAMTAGDIYTIAGTGTQGYSGEGGPATSAELGRPTGPTINAAGNVVFSDAFNERIRVIAERAGTFYGQAMTAGDIYTIAGNGTGGFSGDGGPALAAELANPTGLATDSAGNVLIADAGNGRIRLIAAATGTFYGQAMTAGDIYTIATALEPQAVTVDAAGNVVIGDTDGGRVDVLAARTGTFYGLRMTAGTTYSIAGNGGDRDFVVNGGKAVDAELVVTTGITLDGSGNIVLSGPFARLTMVARQTGTFFGQPMTAGDIYTIAGTGHRGYSGDGGPATSAKIGVPGGPAFDSAGNLVFASDNNRVRVVAAATGMFYGQAMKAGDIYTIAGTGAQGYSGDGGPATSAKLSAPEGVTLDAHGNVLVDDSQNNRVRVIAGTTGTFYGQAMTAGDIYTIAGSASAGYGGDGGPATSARLNGPSGVAVDAHGNVIIADTGNNRVRMVAAATGTSYGQAMTAGDIYTVAGNGTHGFSGDGGPANAAELRDPEGVTVDHAGNLLISDTENNRIRMVAATTGTFYGQARTAGDIYTIAGNGATGFQGDGGPATSARLDWPYGVAITSSGDLLIDDSFNGRVRQVTG